LMFNIPIISQYKQPKERNDVVMKNVRKKYEKIFFFQSSYLFGAEPQLPVGTGSPRLFTYQRRYGRHVK